MQVMQLASKVQSLGLDVDSTVESDLVGPSKSKLAKRKTLEEIRELIKHREGSTISFVLIGTFLSVS